MQTQINYSSKISKYMHIRYFWLKVLWHYTVVAVSVHLPTHACHLEPVIFWIQTIMYQSTCALKFTVHYLITAYNSFCRCRKNYSSQTFKLQKENEHPFTKMEYFHLRAVFHLDMKQATQVTAIPHITATTNKNTIKPTTAFTTFPRCIVKERDLWHNGRDTQYWTIICI